MNIGVFDSGIGGKAIADHLAQDFPTATITYVTDIHHMPYGNRSKPEIIQLTDAAIQPLLAAECDVIVLACNTATAAAIETLRVKYSDTPFVGLEPMVKTAAGLTKTGIVAVCATPSTLRSERYQKLKTKYANSTKVLEPDCSDWAAMIEHEMVDDRKVADTIESMCGLGADVIVLACTHYHWIKEKIEFVAAGRAVVIDPSDAVSRRVRSVIEGKT